MNKEQRKLLKKQRREKRQVARRVDRKRYLQKFHEAGEIARRQHILAVLSKIQKTKRKHRCLAPGCSQKACQSHSQQRQRELKAIAREGHVYTLLRNDVETTKKMMQAHTAMEAHLSAYRLIGVHNATTYPGFCSFHDSEIFKDLEEQDLVPGDKRQAILMGLRSVSHEFIRKEQGIQLAKAMLDSAATTFSFKNREAVVVSKTQIEMAHWLGISMTSSLTIDVEPIFEYYCDSLVNDSKIKFSWGTIDLNLGLAVACVLNPMPGKEYHKHLNEKWNRMLPVCTMNIIPLADRTHVIFTWPDIVDSEAMKWARAGLQSSGEELEEFFNRLLGESEDWSFNPDLWENISQDNKQRLILSIAEDDVDYPLRYARTRYEPLVKCIAPPIIGLPSNMKCSFYKEGI